MAITTAFILYPNLLHSQNIDTIRINHTTQVYDTIRIYDTIVKIDTIWIDPKIKEIRIGPNLSSFLCKWRNYDEQLTTYLSQRNYSVGIETGFVFDKTILQTGVFFTQFNEKRQFEYSITDIESIIQTEIVSDSYIEYDTTGVSWITETYDSTYFNPNLNDTITIIITDSTMLYQIDSTTIIINDTVFNTIYDTITNDTVLAKDFVYKYIEVPLIFKYRIGQFNNFHFNIGVGIIGGLLIKSESYYFDVGTNSVLAYQKGDNYKFMPSLWLSLEINYQLKERFIISLEPYYNPGLKSILKTDVGISGIPDRYGVRFGISFLI